MTKEEIDKENEKIKKTVLEYKIPQKTELIPIKEALERIKTARMKSPEEIFIVEYVFIKNREIKFVEKRAIALLPENGNWKLFVFESSLQLVQVAENISEAIVKEIKKRSIEEGIELLFGLAPAENPKQIKVIDEEKKESYFKSDPGEMFQ